jgi:hypothetical protein
MGLLQDRALLIVCLHQPVQDELGEVLQGEVRPQLQPGRRGFWRGLPRIAGALRTLLGDKPDKIGKDDNFRGLAIFNTVLYYTKGSGGNGVNTVCFLDTTRKAWPNGVGLPAPGRSSPRRRSAMTQPPCRRTACPATCAS